MRLFLATSIVILAAACSSKSGGSSPTPTPTPSPAATPFTVFVRADGNDSAAGTAAAPKKTIPAAIAAAKAQTPSRVHVAAGNFAVDSSLGTNVILAEGVSLYGGFSTDFATRDPATNVTVIDDASTSGTAAARSSAIDARGFVTSATVVDGFTVKGGDGGTYVTAIRCHDGAAPTFSNLVVDAGVSTQTTVGIDVRDGASPSILTSTISGGTAGGTGATVGVLIRGAAFLYGDVIHGGSNAAVSRGISSTGTLIARNDTIDGGTGDATVGISSLNGSALVENTIALGGTAATQSSTAVELGGNGGSILRNCTIVAGASPTASLGVLLSGSAVALRNDIITTSAAPLRHCVEGTVAIQESILNDDLFGCADALWLDGSTSYVAIADVNAFTPTGSAGANVSVDPVFGTGFALSASSPASVTQGATDVTDIVPIDHDGAPRTVPVSIGAYEQN